MTDIEIVEIFATGPLAPVDMATRDSHPSHNSQLSFSFSGCCSSPGWSPLAWPRWMTSPVRTSLKDSTLTSTGESRQSTDRRIFQWSEALSIRIVFVFPLHFRPFSCPRPVNNNLRWSRAECEGKNSKSDEDHYYCNQTHGSQG